MTEDIKRTRDSNIELLRIVCMALVVTHHYAVHSGFSQVSACNRMLLDTMAAGARMAINCFILMTGYFSVAMKRPVWSKLFRMWTERVFYAIAISLVFLIAGLQKFSVAYVARAVLPIITCRHNYVTTFFMLYLFIPYINAGVSALSKKQFLSFLGVFSAVISLVPTFMTLLRKLYVNNSYSYLFWMIFVYCVGAYIRLYGLPLKRKFYVWGGR